MFAASHRLRSFYHTRQVSATALSFRCSATASYAAGYALLRPCGDDLSLGCVLLRNGRNTGSFHSLVDRRWVDENRGPVVR